MSGHLDRADGTQLEPTFRIELGGELTLHRRSWHPSPDGWPAEAADGLACEDACAVPASVELLALPDLDLAAVSAVELLLHGRRADGPGSGEVGFGIERHHGGAGDPDGTVSYACVEYGGWTAAAATTSP